MGFPGGSDGKDSACNAGDPDSIPGLGRSPGEGNATHSSLLPGESHGQRSLAGCISGVAEGRTQLSDYHDATLTGAEVQRLPTAYGLGTSVAPAAM